MADGIENGIPGAIRSLGTSQISNHNSVQVRSYIPYLFD